jgi:hypothetical protein
MTQNKAPIMTQTQHDYLAECVAEAMDSLQRSFELSPEGAHWLCELFADKLGRTGKFDRKLFKNRVLKEAGKRPWRVGV